jgi:hypothetical protein
MTSTTFAPLAFSLTNDVLEPNPADPCVVSDFSSVLAFFSTLSALAFVSALPFFSAFFATLVTFLISYPLNQTLVL